MSQYSQKIKDLLKMLKLEVDNEESLEKDFESILKMFDELSKTEALTESSSLSKKIINISDLRIDEAVYANFRKNLNGQYLKVPSVSKKN